MCPCLLKRFGSKKVEPFYSLHWKLENSMASMTLWVKSLSTHSKVYITKPSKAKKCILRLW